MSTPKNASQGSPRRPPATAHAYDVCERITRQQAANFYYGIRLLPASKRQAMCAVYAFARRIDDIGDDPLEPSRKLQLLADAERELAKLRADGDPVAHGGHRVAHGGRRVGEEGFADGPAGGDPVLCALADARLRFGLPLDALGDLIAGVRMDVEGAQYETFEDLVPYCRRVAGSIGRLCVAIFGAHDMQSAWSLADDLGVAMQLTNILRDVREDADRGRVYLPREELVRYRLSTDGAYSGEDGQFDAFMRFQTARADEWFHRSTPLVRMLDRRSAACVLAMSGIYRRLLIRIERQPERTDSERISLPVWEKALVAARSLLARTW